jgi:hypothetical protein
MSKILTISATEIYGASMMAAQDRAKWRREMAFSAKQAAISNACRAYFPEQHTSQNEMTRNVVCAAADAAYAAALSESEQLLKEDRAAAVAKLYSSGARATGRNLYEKT